MAWLNGWGYRKKITIQGQSGAGTDYQVLLKVGESSGASGYDFYVEGHSSNFPSDKNQSGDLRFTKSDGATLLNFWVEKVEGTSPNRIAYCWVKIEDNLDNNVDIYCYYGNSSATNVSNGDNTFIFFDDFNDNNWTDKWTQGSSTFTINETDGVLDIHGSGADFEYLETSDKVFSPGICLRVKMKDDTSYHYPCEFGFGYRNYGNVGGAPSDRAVLRIICTADEWDHFATDAVGNESDSSCFGADNNYHVYDLTWETGKSKLYQDNSLKSTLTTNIPNSSEKLRLGHPETEGANNWRGIFDWLFVRKYISTEPEFSSASSEEGSGQRFCNIDLWLTKEGWLPFNYRKEIIIDNTSNNNLTYYQIKIILNSDNFDFNLVKDDGSDIRFADSDGTTELYYWREKWDKNSQQAILWVKVPSIPASSSKVIYLYYGNQEAQDASDVENTFIRIIDHLKASWHLDEGEGTTAHDTSGNDNDGTLTNMDPATDWVDGKFGKALDFDGENDYVNVPNSDSLNITDALTIEAWIKPDTLEGVHRIVAKFGNPGGSWNGYSFQQVDSKLEAQAYKNNVGKIGKTTSLTLTTDWNHLFYVFYNGEITLYRNEDSEVISGYPSTIGIVSWDLQIGRHQTAGQYFDGIIDEVRIYNKALSSDEISDLYNNYGYTTTNYPGKVLVRKYNDPEPIVAVEKTYYINILLKQLISLNYNCDVILERIGNYDIDILLRKLKSLIYNIDTLLQKKIFNYNINILIEKIISQYCNIDVLLKSLKSSTYILDILIKKLEYVNCNLDVLLQKFNSINYNIDLIIEEITKKSYSANVLLKALKQESYVSDVLLQRFNSINYDADLILNKIGQSQYSIDLILQPEEGKFEYNCDILLKGILNLNYQSNALLKLLKSIIYNVDISLEKLQSLVYGINAIFNKLELITYDNDILLEQLQSFNYDIDILLKQFSSSIYDINALFKQLQTFTYNIDIIIKIIGKQIPIDIILLKANEIKHSIDVFLLAQRLKFAPCKLNLDYNKYNLNLDFQCNRFNLDFACQEE